MNAHNEFTNGKTTSLPFMIMFDEEWLEIVIT